MSLPGASIRKPVMAWMLFAAMLVFGGIGFDRLGVSQLPDVDFPVVNVSVTREGAAPEVMELDVVEPLESSLMSVEGIKNITSVSRSGSANVTVEFDLDQDIDIAVQEVQTRIAQAQRRLPADVDPPVVSKTNPEDQPILWLGVSSRRLDRRELMKYVRDRVQDRFQTLDGVAEITLGGYVEPNLRVWVRPEALSRYALTASDVVAAIRSEHAEPPSGRLEGARQELNVRTMGEASTPEEFARLSINRRGGGPNFAPIALSEVARVEAGLEDVRRVSRILGNTSVGLGIRKQRGANAVEVARGIRARLAEVKRELPEGTEIDVNFDSTAFIEEAVHELNFTLLLSAILTAVVCWLFLGSFSATLNVILAIPFSIVGAFFALYVTGFTLNAFTLLALTLAIGIVVDDAIMVLENIVRHRELGEEKTLAAYRGTRQIQFAAMATTAAVIAIFLPVAFMEGVIGRYFLQFGVTLSVAVTLSLLEALTLTPMRCAQFLEVGERRSRVGRLIEGGFARAAAAYGRLLPRLLAHRWKLIAAVTMFFAASFALVGLIKKEFVPAQDQSRLMIRMKAPEGSSLEYTDAKVREIEKLLSGRPEITRYFVSIGGFSGGDVSSAMAFVTLKPRGERERGQAEISAELRKAFGAVKGIRVFVQDLSMSGFGASGRGYPVEFTVRGPDWQGLMDASVKLKAAMEKAPELTDVDSDYRGSVDELHVVPDRERARSRGVSVADIGEAISVLVGGAIAGQFAEGGRRYDIRVKVEEGRVRTAADLDRVQVRNNRGELIPLSEVTRVETRPSLLQISRTNRERAISLYSNVASGSSQAEALAAVERLGREILPAGYRLVVGGSAETYRESFRSLVFALLLGIVVSYMVLASQFNSFVDPVTVLVALPFSFSGAFLALLAGGATINLYSMIGLLLLMGLVKKNSIMLVDFTNQRRDEGLGVREALIDACPMRLRPILMTSFATVAGALPPALAVGPGAETSRPMALAVVGGVLVSTVLTLFVVPCVYDVLARRRRHVTLPDEGQAAGELS